MTGTLVHGKIANSVTTAVTNSGGVISYRKLSGVKLTSCCHCDKRLRLVFDTKSFGFPSIKN